VEELANGDLDRARVLHDALWNAYQTVAQLEFDCTVWAVDGYDKASTLSALAELMGPKDVSSADYAEWQSRAYDLLQTGSLR